MSDRLLIALRAATSARHATLDQQLALDGPITRERYAAFLRGSLAAVAALEPALDRWFGLPGPSRIAALTADLAALGDPAPIAADAVDVASQGAALGCVYVVEGSALGGVILAERIERALPGAPTTYLRLRGAATGRVWSEVRRLLAAPLDPTEIAAACTAAERTFDHYQRALTAAGAVA